MKTNKKDSKTRGMQRAVLTEKFIAMKTQKDLKDIEVSLKKYANFKMEKLPL